MQTKKNPADFPRFLASFLYADRKFQNPVPLLYLSFFLRKSVVYEDDMNSLNLVLDLWHLKS